MKTEIINDSEPSAVAPVAYPALYRHKESGSVMCVTGKMTCFRLFSGPGVTVEAMTQTFLDPKEWSGWDLSSWTRLTTPITIKFTP